MAGAPPRSGGQPTPAPPAWRAGGEDFHSREPSPRGGRGSRHSRPHTKVSFGVILVQINPDTRRPEAVLGRGRYSYEFSEFVHGRYSRKNVRMVAALLEAMSLEERLDVYSLDFRQMWFRIWLTAPHRELYYKKLAKFQASWLREDSGEFLRRLVTGAGGEALGAPAPPRWVFPKGRRHSSCELDINCAIREFGEEAGIPKKDYQLLPGIRRRMSYVHMGIRYVNVYYVALARRPLAPAVDLRRLDQAAEVAEVRWFDIEQLRLVDGPARRLEAVAAPVFRYVKKYVRGLAPPRGLAFRLAPATERRGELHDLAAHFDYLQAREAKDAGRGCPADGPPNGPAAEPADGPAGGPAESPTPGAPFTGRGRRARRRPPRGEPPPHTSPG